MKGALRLGLIGCGGIVQNMHIPALLKLSGLVTIVAIADSSAAALDRIGGDLGIPAASRYTDYHDLITSKQVDAVSIATPHSLHAEQVIAAAGEGVAVISEKPMAVSTVEAGKILRAVRQNKVAYTVVHNLLLSPAMKAALKKIQDGAIGRPLLCRGQHLMRKPAGLSGADWRASKERGGGCIIDTAYHEIYSVEALMASPIRHVRAVVKTLNFEIDVDDTALLLFEHENGSVSTVSAAWYASAIGHEKGRWCEAHGADGSIRVNHRSNEALMHIAREDQDWHAPALDMTQKGHQQTEDPTGHAGFFAAAMEALRDGSPMPVTGEQARHNLAVIEAAREASRKNKTIRVR